MMEETLSCFCNACSCELGQFRNAWNVIGSNYYSPVYPIVSFEDGFTGKGDVRSVVLGKHDACFLQDLVCNKCRVYLGIRCDSAPSGHLLKKNQYLLRLSEITTLIAGTSKKAQISVKNTFILETGDASKNSKSRASSIGPIRSKSMSVQPSNRRASSMMPPPPIPTPKISGTPVMVTTPAPIPSAFQIWAEKEIKDQRKEINRISGAADRIETTMNEFKTFMAEVRGQRTVDQENQKNFQNSASTQIKADISELHHRLEESEKKTSTTIDGLHYTLQESLDEQAGRIAESVENFGQNLMTDSDALKMLISTLNDQFGILTARVDSVDGQAKRAFSAVKRSLESLARKANASEVFESSSEPFYQQTKHGHTPVQMPYSVSDHNHPARNSSAASNPPLQKPGARSGARTIQESHSALVAQSAFRKQKIQSTTLQGSVLRPKLTGVETVNKTASSNSQPYHLAKPAQTSEAARTPEPDSDKVANKSVLTVEIPAFTHDENVSVVLSSPNYSSASGSSVESIPPSRGDKRKRTVSSRPGSRGGVAENSDMKKRNRTSYNSNAKAETSSASANTLCHLDSPDTETSAISPVHGDISPILGVEDNRNLSREIVNTQDTPSDFISQTKVSMTKNAAHRSFSAFSSNYHSVSNQFFDSSTPTNHKQNGQPGNKHPKSGRQTIVGGAASYRNKHSPYSFTPRSKEASYNAPQQANTPIQSVESDLPHAAASRETPPTTTPRDISQPKIPSRSVPSKAIPPESSVNEAPTPEQIKNPYKCGGCDRRFGKLQGFKIHKNSDPRCKAYTSRDSMPLDFICSGCQQIFDSLDRFNSHDCNTAKPNRTTMPAVAGDKSSKTRNAEKRKSIIAAREELVRETMEREMARSMPRRANGNRS